MNSDLRYELEGLEALLLRSFVPPEGQHAIGDSTIPEGIRTELGKEVERIKKTLAHEVFVFSDERSLERYIQLHQQELIRIADELLGRKGEYFSDSPPGNDLQTFLQYACGSVEDLLTFIERHFIKYLTRRPRLRRVISF